MDHARLMRFVEPGGELLDEVDDAIDGQVTGRFQRGREVASLDERHADVLRPLHLANVMNPDDVAMRYLAGQQQLPLEARLQLFRHHGIRADLRTDQLERDCFAELLVPRVIDDAHPARAQDAENAIARAKGVARTKERCRGRWRVKLSRGLRSGCGTRLVRIIRPRDEGVAVRGAAGRTGSARVRLWRGGQDRQCYRCVRHTPSALRAVGAVKASACSAMWTDQKGDLPCRNRMDPIIMPERR